MQLRIKPAASLKNRLLLAQSAVFAASLLGFAISYIAFEQGDTRYHVIDDIYPLTEDLGRAIVRSPDGKARFVIPESLDGDIAEHPDARFGAIDEDTGAVVADSRGGETPPDELPRDANVREGWLNYIDDKGIWRNGVFNRVKTTTGKFRVFIVQKEQKSGLFVEGLTEELGGEILPVFAPMMLIGLLFTSVTLTMTLRPLRRASKEAQAIAMDRPGQRLSTDRLPLEIQPLVAAVNTAIGRLESALEQQRRFSANTAHQLRTPLAILKTRIDALPGSPLRMELERDVDRMTRLVGQLLTASRLEAGQFTELRRIDLTEFMQGILADIAPLAHNSNRDLELIAPGPVMAVVSTSAVEEAVRNLIDNALRHTPIGTTVSVCIEPGASIAVRDRGPGVPLEVREQVFEPFWSGSRTHGGAGLGLAIVHEAAELHGGTVTIEDADGGGAVFRLNLPQRAPEKSPPIPGRRRRKGTNRQENKD